MVVAEALQQLLLAKRSAAEAHARLTELFKGPGKNGFAGLAELSMPLANMYGELLPEGIEVLARMPGIDGGGARFVDLGSGVGKLVMYVAMRFNVRSSMGIEVVSFRHAVAATAARNLQGDARVASISLLRADVQDFNYSRGSHYYSYNTFFDKTTYTHITERLIEAVALDGETRWLLASAPLPLPLPAAVTLHATVPNVSCSFARTDFQLYCFAPSRSRQRAFGFSSIKAA